MSYSTKDDFNCENIKILSVDFETTQITERDDDNNARSQIFAAGFCSNTGFTEAIHLEDSKFNNDEVKFIRYIVYKIQSFQGIITGWYLANSDLVVLDEVCKCIGVVSPVGFYEVPVITPQEHADEEDSDDNNNNTEIVLIELLLYKGHLEPILLLIRCRSGADNEEAHHTLKNAFVCYGYFRSYRY